MNKFKITSTYFIEQDHVKTTEELDYSIFMHGLVNAPIPQEYKCKQCYDYGYMPIWCCGGNHCVCMGMPAEYDPCEYCDAEPVNNVVIKQWSDKAKLKVNFTDDVNISFQII